ncbi:M91 family zinc metallopeptidase [Pseudomonas maumuensis]|uniref:Effector protein n=1 Tax=Pseudomonas maumuensis TaxID=2842354 RepID=A0ABX8NHK3_9PSED|nr:M91 family zinc metallopeptidase [Pseudomonas maumuensis]QXH55271.1 hypothetical protein KSS90_18260 [Pseudomonas maumuensis]
MSLNHVVVNTPVDPPRHEPLPFRDRQLAIFQEGTALRIEVLIKAVELRVEPRLSGISIHVWDVVYEVEPAPGQLLHIKTGKGNDKVLMLTDASTLAVIETGEGDDEVHLQRMGSAQTGGSVVVGAGPGADRVIAKGQADVEIEGGSGNDLIVSDADLGMLHCGPGDDRVYVEGGRAIIEALTGDNRLTTGALDDRVYGRVGNVTPVDGFDAPLMHSLDDASLPQAYTQTFDIQGSPEYIQHVIRHLNVLRASPTASVLLEDLVARNVKVKIEHSDMLDNATAGYDRAQGGAGVVNGSRGARIQEMVVSYNPLVHMPGFPSLVILYHELCHAWNFATGSILGNGEMQAVGLDSGQPPFDFDDDAATPAVSTNPDPFNENALRRELGLPARLTYP